MTHTCSVCEKEDLSNVLVCESCEWVCCDECDNDPGCRVDETGCCARKLCVGCYETRGCRRCGDMCCVLCAAEECFICVERGKTNEYWLSCKPCMAAVCKVCSRNMCADHQRQIDADEYCYDDDAYDDICDNCYTRLLPPPLPPAAPEKQHEKEDEEEEEEEEEEDEYFDDNVECCFDGNDRCEPCRCITSLTHGAQCGLCDHRTCKGCVRDGWALWPLDCCEVANGKKTCGHCRFQCVACMQYFCNAHVNRFTDDWGRAWEYYESGAKRTCSDYGICIGCKDVDYGTDSESKSPPPKKKKK